MATKSAASNSDGVLVQREESAWQVGWEISSEMWVACPLAVIEGVIWEHYEASELS
jgi:hypothetical protein